MRAHLVQMDIAWEDRAANFAKVERLLERADPDAGDLVVLPEMFDTGFSMNTAETADMAGETLRFLVRIAEDLGVFVQGGRTVRACTKTDCKAENRCPVVGPDGALLVEYAKIHPFTYGREAEFFQGGREVVTYRWEGARSGKVAKWQSGKVGEDVPAHSGTLPLGHAATSLIVCPAVCYDLRFPELFRIGLGKGAEAFAIGANWPEARQFHWRTLLIARAIENQAFVFGVNRTGEDPKLKYAGGTIAVGPRGEILGELEAGSGEGVLSVEVDPWVVRKWREEFPAWRDGRLVQRTVNSEQRT